MRVPRYRPISKAELGKRGLIYGTGSRAKRPHRLTVLLAAQQNVFIRQAICNVQEPAAPPVPHPPRFRALALFGRRPPERVDRLGIPGRVDEDVAILIPHSPGCAAFPLPVLHGRVSLGKGWGWGI